MGVLVAGLEAEAYDRHYSDAALTRRVAAYFRPHRRMVVLIVGLMIATAAIEAAVPLAVSFGIDTLVAAPGLGQLLGLAGGIIALGLLHWLFSYLRRSWLAQTVAAVTVTIRDQAFDAAMRHDLSFYDQHPSGKIISRITSDTEDFTNLILIVIETGSQILVFVLLSILLLTLNLPLALVSIAMLLLVIAVAAGFRRVAYVIAQRGQRIVAQINATIRETISGIAVAKRFRQEAAIYADFRATNQMAYQIRLRQGIIFGFLWPVLGIVGAIGTVIVLYAGGLQVTRNTLSSGDWYLFVQALLLSYIPLTSIAAAWSQIQQGLSAGERVFALIDAEPRVIQSNAQTIPALQGHIQLRNVSLQYTDENVVLPNLSLDVAPGERVALVGHTGAGKTSIIRLIARLYEFQAGSIEIDGHDIRSLDLAHYRTQLGIVPQVPFLFSGSVADNIRYGRPSATDEMVAAVAQQIGDGAWLDNLHRGLATEVGERGTRLSLGQRQLIALARVLLQDPAIFLLDEATASIDPFTEMQIQAGLQLVMQGRTSITVAHRLSTVVTADRIIVLERGQIREQGTHQQLLERGGYYATLYDTYFRHQSLTYVEQIGDIVTQRRDGTV